MKKIDLIIEALEFSLTYTPHYARHEAALAAARELKALKPVAWGVMRKNNNGLKMLSLNQGVEIDLKWIPLFALEQT